MGIRARDAEAEQLERDAYRVLAHLDHAAAGSWGTWLLGARVADALRLPRPYALRVFRFLADEGHLALDVAGPCLSITECGAGYLETGAGRRQSVRPAHAA